MAKSFRDRSPRLAKPDFDEMRAEANIGATAKMPGLLPLFVGVEVILTESVLPPKYVRGTPGKVAGIELHALEPPVEGRKSMSRMVLCYSGTCRRPSMSRSMTATSSS